MIQQYEEMHVKLILYKSKNWWDEFPYILMKVSQCIRDSETVYHANKSSYSILLP
jgi:hypothetical protein